MARPCYLDNDELEAAILRGDRDELTRLLLILAEHVVATARSRGRIPEGMESEDVIQAAVMDALRRLEAWEPGRSSAFSYASGSVNFTIMAEAKRDRKWSGQHSHLFESNEEVFA